MSNLKVTNITDRTGTGSPSFPNRLKESDMPIGSVIQVGYVESNTVGNGTTQIPLDDTIPQNNEGNLILTLAFTPKFSNSKLHLHAKINGIESANVSSALVVGCIFRSDSANAIAVEYEQNLVGNIIGTTNIEGANLSVIRQITSGTTSTLTFTVRAGLSGPGASTPFIWNGYGASPGTRLFGGAQYCSLTIQEIKQ